MKEVKQRGVGERTIWLKAMTFKRQKTLLCSTRLCCGDEPGFPNPGFAADGGSLALSARNLIDKAIERRKKGRTSNQHWTYDRFVERNHHTGNLER